MTKKLDRELLKKEFEILDEEDKEFLKELLRSKGEKDIDLIGEILKLTKRLDDVEKKIEKPVEKKKGFLSFFE